MFELLTLWLSKMRINSLIHLEEMKREFSFLHENWLWRWNLVYGGGNFTTVFHSSRKEAFYHVVTQLCDDTNKEK